MQRPPARPRQEVHTRVSTLASPHDFAGCWRRHASTRSGAISGDRGSVGQDVRPAAEPGRDGGLIRGCVARHNTVAMRLQPAGAGAGLRAHDPCCEAAEVARMLKAIHASENRGAAVNKAAEVVTRRLMTSSRSRWSSRMASCWARCHARTGDCHLMSNQTARSSHAGNSFPCIFD